MEWLTIVLSGMMTLLVPAGAILDTVLAGVIRARVKETEHLAVRVDNTPSYRALEGKFDRLRVASRGAYPLPGVRIDTLELETDPVDIDLNRLQSKGGNFFNSLRKPASGAARAVLTEEDINRALESPEVKKQLQTTLDRVIPRQPEMGATSYLLKAAKINFLNGNRLGLNLDVMVSRQGEASQNLKLELKARINIVGGYALRIDELEGSLNGRRLAERILRGFAEGLSGRFSLKELENSGIFARVIRLEIDDNRLQVAAFARVNPIGNKDKP